jgi:phosphate transport system substrate-binding protein
VIEDLAMHLKLATVAAIGLLAVPAGAASIKVDAALPAYKPPSGLSGAIVVNGSDSVDPLIQQWLSAFHAAHPNVSVKATAQGTTQGFLCLLENTCTVGTMSREMSKAELSAFEEKYGYKPTRVAVAVGALAIFVHASNPITAISLEQLDAIYSMTRKAGIKEPIFTWGQLGLGGDWASRRITPYGRDEHSGTRSFFKEKVLLKGDSRANVNTMSDAQSLGEAVSLDPTAIGYGNFNDANSLMKTVPMAVAGASPTLPTYDGIMKGDYSLVRFYYVYVNKPTGKPLPAQVLSFLQYMLSREGQLTVASVGLIPVPADLAAGALQRLK